DVADRAAVRGPLDLQLRDHTAFDECYARFTNIDVDDNYASGHSSQCGAQTSTRLCCGATFIASEITAFDDRAFDNQAFDDNAFETAPPAGGLGSREQRPKAGPLPLNRVSREISSMRAISCASGRAARSELVRRAGAK